MREIPLGHGRGVGVGVCAVFGHRFRWLNHQDYSIVCIRCGEKEKFRPGMRIRRV